MEHKIQEEKGHKTRLERWSEARPGELVDLSKTSGFYPRWKEKSRNGSKQRRGKK